MNSIERSRLVFFDAFNGLYLHVDKGQLNVFATDVQMYWYWLHYLHQRYPSGYIEVPYYVSEYYDIPLNEVNKELRHRSVTDKTSWVVLVDWKSLDKTSTLVLVSLAQRLHKFLGTTFDKESLEKAIKKYYEHNESFQF